MKLRSVPLAFVLAGCAVLLASCGGGPSSPSAGGGTGSGGDPYGGGGANRPTPSPGTSADVTITIQGEAGSMSFSPASASVKVGQTVSWQNADSITHAVAPDGGGGFGTGNISPGSTSGPFKVSASGNFPYHCSIHPSMVGALNVAQ